MTSTRGFLVGGPADGKVLVLQGPPPRSPWTRSPF